MSTDSTILLSRHTTVDQKFIRCTRAMIAAQLGKCSVNVDVISEPNDEGVFHAKMKAFKEPNRDGLQPTSDGLQPKSDGLQLFI